MVLLANLRLFFTIDSKDPKECRPIKQVASSAVTGSMAIPMTRGMSVTVTTISTMAFAAMATVTAMAMVLCAVGVMAPMPTVFAVSLRGRVEEASNQLSRASVDEHVTSSVDIDTQTRHRRGKPRAHHDHLSMEKLNAIA